MQGAEAPQPSAILVFSTLRGIDKEFLEAPCGIDDALGYWNLDNLGDLGTPPPLGAQGVQSGSMHGEAMAFASLEEQFRAAEVHIRP